MSHACLQLTNNYNQALRTLGSTEHQARNTFLQLHAAYVAQWPAVTTLRDCPEVSLPAVKNFDSTLPETQEADVEALRSSLQAAATGSSYEAFMATVPALPAFNRDVFAANQPVRKAGIVADTDEATEPQDSELQEEVARLQLEVLALHAECYLLATPAEDDRRFAHRTASAQSRGQPPPPLTLTLQPPALLSASLLSPIPEQSASDEVEHSISASETTDASSPSELLQCKRELQRAELENTELQAQLATLQAACDGLQQQLEEVDLQEAEQDLAQSRIGRLSSVVAVRVRGHSLPLPLSLHMHACLQAPAADTPAADVSPKASSRVLVTTEAQTEVAARRAMESQTDEPETAATTQSEDLTASGLLDTSVTSESGLSTIDIANHPLHLGLLGMIPPSAQSAPWTYLLGCRGADRQWYTVALCASTLSTERAKDILRSMTKLAPDAKLPSWLQLGSASNRPGYVLRDPNTRLVAAVVGTELQESDRYAAGVTVRQPKVQSLVTTEVGCLRIPAALAADSAAACPSPLHGAERVGASRVP